MDLADRNRIVPQMAEYDQVGDQCVPYLMRFDRPFRTFPSVTTGSWGLRNTVLADGKILNVESIEEQATAENIVLGSSAVFGVGATHDRFTIPSWLSRLTGRPWLNFGGRALNSTQELILLLLHFPHRLDNLIVVSGVNNLTLAYLSESPSSVYNSFFYQSVYERAMANPPGEHIGVRRAAAQLVTELRHRLLPVEGRLARSSVEEVYNGIMTCFRRDLRALAAMANGLGAAIHFALQPMASWIERNASVQEQQLFTILDSMSMDWKVLARHIGEARNRYFADIAAACREFHVPFCNLNLAPEFASSEWLFVDRVHLTDLGHERAAQALMREFAI